MNRHDPSRLMLLEIKRHHNVSLLFAVEEISSSIARLNNNVQFPMPPWFRFQTKLPASKSFWDKRYELHVHFLSNHEKVSGTGSKLSK